MEIALSPLAYACCLLLGFTSALIFIAYYRDLEVEDIVHYLYRHEVISAYHSTVGTAKAPAPPTGVGPGNRLPSQAGGALVPTPIVGGTTDAVR